MADKNIGSLREATSLDNDSLFVAEQQGNAVQVAASLFRAFAENAGRTAAENLTRGPQGEPGTSIVSIERTNGNGAAGTTDTYTITLSDGSAETFTVYNGKDGGGAGDMTKAVYDPTGRNGDIFAYADKKMPILGGKFTGAVYAGVQTPGTALIRNIRLVTTDTEPTVEGEIVFLCEEA